MKEIRHDAVIEKMYFVYRRPLRKSIRRLDSFCSVECFHHSSPRLQFKIFVKNLIILASLFSSNRKCFWNISKALWILSQSYLPSKVAGPNHFETDWDPDPGFHFDTAPDLDRNPLVWNSKAQSSYGHIYWCLCWRRIFVLSKVVQDNITIVCPYKENLFQVHRMGICLCMCEHGYLFMYVHCQKNTMITLYLWLLFPKKLNDSIIHTSYFVKY